MFYIKLNDDMSLVITVRQPIYRGENLSEKIIYLIPFKVGEIDVLTSCVYLNYIRPDGTPDVVELERLDERYNESYYQYTFPINCNLTKYAGVVCTWLHFYAGDPNNPTTKRSGECSLRIQEAKNIDAYVGDKTVTAIYKMKQEMEAGFKEIEDDISGKADNLRFDTATSSIQLTANGKPIGDSIMISSGIPGVGISDAYLSDSGELIIVYSNGAEKNVGIVVDNGGKIYIPHISQRKVLSWTIEDQPGKTPDPVDLNPFDEWGDINESEVSTDYVWEKIDE